MTFIWFTYLFNSSHKMKDFKGIPMGQFIFVVLFWHFLFVCVDANYPQKAKQLDSKEGNIQRHLVDVSHFKRAGNVLPKKKAGSVSPTLDIATLKGNVALPIDLENHYRNKLWSLGKLLTGISNRNMFSYDGSIEDSNIVQSIDKIDVEGQRTVYGVDIKNIDDNHNGGDDNVLESEEERDGDRYDYDDDSDDNDNGDNEDNNDEYVDSDNDHEDETDNDVDDSGDKEYDDGNDNNNALYAAGHNLPHRINPRGLGRIVTKGGRNKYKPVLPQKQSDTCECGIYNPKEVKKSHLRIVNGVETAKNQYPWMASIRYTGANHFCGGSIISDQFILTAAHCTFGMKPDEMQVTIGDHDLTSNDVSRVQTIDVKKIFNHPNYDDFTTNNDLALLQLKKKIKFTWKTNPICLTPQDLTYYRETVTVMGWGKRNENHKTGSPVLKHVQVKVLPMHKCRNDFRYKKGDISPKMLCAYEQGHDACQGDSGGPLVWKEPRQDRYFQIGATSWGIGCASKFHPGVYTKLAKFLEWIYETAKDSTFCKTYIPKGAKKRYKDGNKARLDKEQTKKMKDKKMKDKKKEKENDSSEEDGVQYIKFEEEEATTVGSIMISDNSNENIDNEQEESTWMPANYTVNVISTTEKNHFANESIDFQGPNNNEGVNGSFATTNIVQTSTETNIQSHNSRKGKSNDYVVKKDEEVKIDLNKHTHSSNQKSSTNRQNKKIKGDISSKKRKNKKKGKKRIRKKKGKKRKNKKKGKKRKNKKKAKKRINIKKGKGRLKFSKKKNKGLKKAKSTGKNKRKWKHSNKLKNVSNKKNEESKTIKFRKQTRKRYRKKSDIEKKQTKN